MKLHTGLQNAICSEDPLYKGMKLVISGIAVLKIVLANVKSSPPDLGPSRLIPEQFCQMSDTAPETFPAHLCDLLI
jgi:hypothetical protein